MEPVGTQLYTVDASACGAKGLFWRTHLGGGKFVMQGASAPGFAPNGFQFRGLEEYKHWVRRLDCAANDQWLPLFDVPGAAVTDPSLQLKSRHAPAPFGRGRTGRAPGTALAVPYLHTEGCQCSGRWCRTPPPAPLPPPPDRLVPKRRKELAVVEQEQKAVAQPPPTSWTWLLCVLLAVVVGWAAARVSRFNRLEPNEIGEHSGWDARRHPQLFEVLTKLFP